MKKSEMQKQMEVMSQENEFYKRENEKLNAEITRRQQEEWDKLRPKATEIFHREMDKIFPEMVCKVTLEHIDAGGFWFTFELKNDNRRQRIYNTEKWMLRNYGIFHRDRRLDCP